MKPFRGYVSRSTSGILSPVPQKGRGASFGPDGDAEEQLSDGSAQARRKKGTSADARGGIAGRRDAEFGCEEFSQAEFDAGGRLPARGLFPKIPPRIVLAAIAVNACLVILMSLVFGFDFPKLPEVRQAGAPAVQMIDLSASAPATSATSEAGGTGIPAAAGPKN